MHCRLNTINKHTMVTFVFTAMNTLNVAYSLNAENIYEHAQCDTKLLYKWWKCSLFQSTSLWHNEIIQYATRLCFLIVLMQQVLENTEVYHSFTIQTINVFNKKKIISAFSIKTRANTAWTWAQGKQWAAQTSDIRNTKTAQNKGAKAAFISWLHLTTTIAHNFCFTAGLWHHGYSQFGEKGVSHRNKWVSEDPRSHCIMS